MMNLVSRLIAYQHSPFAPTWSNFARFESVMAAIAFLFAIDAAIFCLKAYLYPIFKMVTHSAATSSFTEEHRLIEELHNGVKADVAQFGQNMTRLLNGSCYALIFILIWFNDARLLQGFLLYFGFYFVVGCLLSFSKKVRLGMLVEGLTLFAVGFTVTLLDIAVTKVNRLYERYFKRQATSSAKG